MSEALSIDSGDTAWVLVSTALVMFMTPGVGFFYAGLEKHRNILVTLTYSFISLAVISITWYLIIFSLVFGPSADGSHFIGNADYSVLLKVSGSPNPHYGPTIPFAVFFIFQLKFAAITPALITGAIANRIKFWSFIVFITLWGFVVYGPIGHWVWNVEGWAFKLGSLDFAGGTVVHINAGFSALAAAIVIGKRKDMSHSKPCNIPFVLLGVTILWFGWFGFNGGSALAANGLAANACIVTNISACSAAISWMICETLYEKKKSLVGLGIGAVIGLVAITPASGFVTAWGAIIMGATASPFCYFATHLCKKLRYFDDTLDVFSCHGLGGVWGSILTGFFASTDVNPAGANGVVFGEGALLWKQIVVTIAAAAWSFVISGILLLLIKYTIGLRVSEEGEKVGMDKFTLNEIAVVLEEHMDLFQDHPNDRQLEMTHHRRSSSQLTLKRGEGVSSVGDKDETTHCRQSTTQLTLKRGEGGISIEEKEEVAA